jgi:hypothetical protein
MRTKPKRRLFDVLVSQGMHANQATGGHAHQ